jgi:hypothetical protein
MTCSSAPNRQKYPIHRRDRRYSHAELECIGQTRIPGYRPIQSLVDLMALRRIVIPVENPAQPTAHSLVQYLEQGGFRYIARAGIADRLVR